MPNRFWAVQMHKSGDVALEGEGEASDFTGVFCRSPSLLSRPSLFTDKAEPNSGDENCFNSSAEYADEMASHARERSLGFLLTVPCLVCSCSQDKAFQMTEKLQAFRAADKGAKDQKKREAIAAAVQQKVVHIRVSQFLLDSLRAVHDQPD
jgi:hypothetical protein